MEETILDTFSEITEIFKYLDDSLLEKIPKDVRDKIISNRNEEYIFKYDKTKTLEEQPIKEETKNLLAMLYIEYCCDDDEKKQIIEKCEQNNILEEQKYKYEGLFESKVKDNEEKEELNLIVHKKENFLAKLIRIIKSLFISK